MTDRSCGGCTACCFTHEIPIIRKPIGSWCTHCTISGCTIYDTKPAACTNYRCAWLKGVGTDADRPDRVNAVFDLVVRNPRLGPEALEVLEIVEGASTRAGLQAIIHAQLAKGLDVFVSACGKDGGVFVLAEGHSLPRERRRALKKNDIVLLTAAEYAKRQKSPAG